MNKWYKNHEYAKQNNTLDGLHELMIDEGLEICPICREKFVSKDIEDVFKLGELPDL
jgi:hypothetical protein